MEKINNDNKRLAFLGVVAVIIGLPKAGHAAIDDAGMKYISASEGLSGSIRVRMLENAKDSGKKPEVGFDDTRIIYNGESDLGGGLTATYFLEFRPEKGREALETEYLDAGLKGPFGHIRIGDIESVSEAIVPSADRTNDVGNTGRQFAEDYDHGVRWVSPSINGLVLGISGETRSVDRGAENKDSFDQYDVAFVYSLPQGIDLGASYAIRPFVGDRTATQDNKSAVRLGLAYARSNWGIGYNFHRHKADTRITFDGESFQIGTTGTADRSVDANKDTEYTEHVVGANFKLGKFAFGLGVSKADIENESISDSDTATDGNQPYDAEFLTSMVDIAYSLGSRAKVIAAYEDNKIEGSQSQVLQRSKEYYLLYRIDF